MPVVPVKKASNNPAGRPRKTEIQRLLEQAVSQGRTVVVISPDLPRAKPVEPAGEALPLVVVAS
jgi:hypothetical protein